MATTLTEDEILGEITDYVRREFLGEAEGGEGSQLEPTTLLLQLGILDSTRTGRLLAHINEQFAVAAPPTRFTGKHFRDLASISALVGELAEVLGPPGLGLRAALVGAQLSGVAIARCLAGVEPLASAPLSDVIAWITPALGF